MTLATVDRAIATAVRAKMRRIEQTEWSSLALRAPFPHMTQTSPYVQAKSTGRWHSEYFVIEKGGDALAVVASIKVKVAGVTVVTRINRGPIFLNAAPGRDEVLDVFASVRAHWKFLFRGALLIAPNLERTEENQALLKSIGFHRRAERTWGSGRVDLRRTEEEIWASFDGKFRNQARKAEKLGATVAASADDATFEWMLSRHEENMAAKGFSGADADFLRRLRSEAGADNMPVFQLTHEGSHVAGGIVYRFGRTAEYYVGWVGQAGREIAAGNSMLCRMMLEMKRRGCESFDVGGMSGTERYSQFKQGTKPAVYDLAGEWMAF